MTKYIIVGAGECGARAAFALRENGFEGDITLIGSETVAPYERPPLSKFAVEEGSEPKFVASLGKYDECRIQLLLGVTAQELDLGGKRLTLSDQSTVIYDKLLLATGSRARPMPGAPAESGRFRSLRTHRDALAIKDSMMPGMRIVVIGGGFIGMEVAAIARKLGADVVVIEGLDRILKRGVPDEVAHFLAARHQREGVTLRCGVSISKLREEHGKAVVGLSTGEAIVADLVVVGIGAIPNTELASRAGLEVDNGIAVDSNLRTSAPDVFAAGDCCSFPSEIYGGRRIRLESWRNAQEQGTLAALNMMGAEQSTSSVPWFWSDQYDFTLQIAGLADGAVTHIRRELGSGAFILFHLDAEGRLLGASGIGPGNAVARDIRLAEMLIAARACPDPTALVSPNIKLKSLLAACFAETSEGIST